MRKTNNDFQKLVLKLFLLIFFLSFFNSCHAVPEKRYYYDSIKVEIKINQDSTFDVIETQTFNLTGSFGYFYRDIALKKLDHISDIEVFDENGRRLNKNEYTVSYNGNRLNIRWEFPRRNFYNELKSWTIRYKVYGGLGFYEKWDELYWNAIFEDREVLVKKAEVLVHLPKNFDKDEIALKLFVGEKGSLIQSTNYKILDSKTVKFWAQDIKPYHFLTIVVAWPKGAIKKPLFYRNQMINWIVLIIGIALPVFTFFKMFVLWREKGKDPKIKKTIIAQYTPPSDLPPAIFGVLIDQSIEMRDIIATVIDLAVRGYLRIIEEKEKILFFKKKRYIFEKLKDEGDLNPFEKKIMRTIFRNKKMVSSEDLRCEFYKEIPEIKELIYQEVAKTDYFTGNIQKIRKKYGKLGNKIFLFTLFIGIFGIFIFSGHLSRYFAQALIIEISMGICALIIIGFAYYMPSLTQTGAEAKWKLLGFKDYLQTAERFRLGAETIETFSKYLPFALVLGVEKKWAARFADFSYQEQNWYVPSVYISDRETGESIPSSFNSFAESISSFTSSISSTFRSTPSGGGGGVGGGSAGGGGGGGGGGAG